MIARPRSAVFVSAAALFATLGGTAIATTLSDSAVHHHTQQPITARQVKKLIAAYLKAHPAPRGRVGAQGPPGSTGATGQPGPGATQVNVVQGSNTGATVGAAGPWTLRMSCFPGGLVSVNITGPGSYYDTTVTGTPGPSAASTAVGNGKLGVSGFTRNTMTSGQQLSENVHLLSGTTMYELHLQLTGTGSTEPSCTLVGSILPVTGSG